jgi:uncharacterized protein (TIGR00369 family)
LISTVTTRHKIAVNQFLKHIDFKIDKIEPGVIEGHIDFQEFHQQQDGWVHGGVISTICDMVAGYASYSMVEEGQRVVTVEIKISYFNPGKGERIFGRGQVLKTGRRFHFCESEVYARGADGANYTIAKATTTMAVIEK